MKSTDLRPGMAIMLDGNMWVITQYTHVTPGNLRAFVQVKIKNLESGVIVEKRLRAGEDVERIELDRRPMEYLFSSGGTHTFMDTETFDQHELGDDLVLGHALVGHRRVPFRTRARSPDSPPI